jgi:hypothetical protein
MTPHLIHCEFSKIPAFLRDFDTDVEEDHPINSFEGQRAAMVFDSEIELTATWILLLMTGLKKHLK